MCEFCFAFKHKNCGFAPFSELPTTCADTTGNGGGAAFDCENSGGGLSRPIAGDPDCVGACDADECCGMCFLSLFVVVVLYVVRACAPFASPTDECCGMLITVIRFCFCFLAFGYGLHRSRFSVHRFRFSVGCGLCCHSFSAFYFLFLLISTHRHTFLELPTTCADTDGNGVEDDAFDCTNDGGNLGGSAGGVGELSRPIAGAGACDGACDADECCGMLVIISCFL